MAPRNQLLLEEQRDFSGGLNLSVDPYKLERNETFDLQNVDLDRRGGFGLRRGIRPYIETRVGRVVTAAGASRTANVVTATGLRPLNGDPGGLVAGQRVTVNFTDNSYDGTFVVATAVGGASTATWIQAVADDPGAGPGTIVEEFSTPDSGYTYVDQSATRHILVARGGAVKRWDGNAWQQVIVQAPGSGRTQFAEFRNVLYLLPPNVTVPYTWTGAGLATQLTTVVGNYNDDYTAPNDGNFPQCRVIATHKEVMWAGGVIEAVGPSHNSRVRWSHPGRGQDWATDDFIDVDPDDENGLIKALVPFGDRLLVFKDKAVYAIHGAPPKGFTVENLTKQLGAPSQGATTATEQYVYFWDVDTGVWRYDGKQFEWVFEPLYRLIDDSKINVAFSYQTILEYHRDRLWVSVPMLAPPYDNQLISLVYQPEGKKGPWTVHDKTLFGWWVHRGSDGGDEHLIGGGVSSGHLVELDVEDLFEDTIFQGTALRLLDGTHADPGAATTPDSAAHDITSDIEIQFDAFREDWNTTTGVNGEAVASKWQAVAGGRSWYVILTDTGLIDFNWSTNGTNEFFLDSTIPLPNELDRQAVRITFDVDDGAGNKVLSIYTRDALASPDWILHETVPQAGTTSIFNSSAPMVVGAATEAAGTLGGHFAGVDGFTGEVYNFSVKNGINGPNVANPSFGSQAAFNPQFTDSAGLVWTMVNGAHINIHPFTKRIIAWYTTRWFDAGKSAQKKRWKRPVVVTRAGATQKTLVDVFRDYDPTRVFKTFEFNTVLEDDTGIWDDPDDDWDVAKWAAEVTLAGEKSVVLRGVPLSGGIARALKFKNTTKGQDWRIHGLTMKWIPRRIRN